ncbi:MAG: AEC family transporter [Marinobacterium sp.]|nr:AEC family transporter [Marinobacterium sp.]
MNGIVASILPIIILLLLGFLCRHYWLTDKAFWSNINKLIYYAMFPCLMVYSIGTADLSNTDYSFIPVLIILVLIFISVIWIGKPFFKDQGFWVAFIQGAVRYNSYVFIAVTLLYISTDVMPVIALITAFLVLTTNVISAFILNFYSENQIGLVKTAISTLTNPLVFSCLLGLSINELAQIFPVITQISWLNRTLEHIGDASLALSLISVGASLNLGVFRYHLMGILLCSGIKLLLLPLAVVTTLIWLEADPLLILVCMIYAGSPCSANATAMTEAMGGDYESMSLIISTQTVLCVLTLPLLMYIYGIYQGTPGF